MNKKQKDNNYQIIGHKYINNKIRYRTIDTNSITKQEKNFTSIEFPTHLTVINYWRTFIDNKFNNLENNNKLKPQFLNISTNFTEILKDEFEIDIIGIKKIGSKIEIVFNKKNENKIQLVDSEYLKEKCPIQLATYYENFINFTKDK